MIKYQKALVIHRYYKITKFYKFLGSVGIKAGISLATVVILLIGLEYFLIDIDSILNKFVENFSIASILLTFSVSETVLGLIPPEIFIAWAAKTNNPWIFLSILASLSYIGGIISYFIGKGISKNHIFKARFENRNAKHILNLRKWGGLFIIIGALLPLPHSIVSIACGIISYKIWNYLLWALFRFLRFLIYGLIIFKII